jgi:hypothetical protein
MQCVLGSRTVSQRGRRWQTSLQTWRTKFTMLLVSGSNPSINIKWKVGRGWDCVVCHQRYAHGPHRPLRPYESRQEAVACPTLHCMTAFCRKKHRFSPDGRTRLTNQRSLASADGIASSDRNLWANNMPTAYLHHLTDDEIMYYKKYQNRIVPEQNTS